MARSQSVHRSSEVSAFRVALLVVCGSMFHTASAGAIADQFGLGHDGVPWGSHLAEVVGMFPGGDHMFGSYPGSRIYSVRNDDPLFGVPREGMRVQYCFAKGDDLYQFGIAVPYERREQLLGSLISLFGPYASIEDVGTSKTYLWPSDHGISVAVRASRDPTNGILEIRVSRASQQVSNSQPR